MSANDKTGVGSGNAEWQTPMSLFDALDRRFRFNYDAFASHENRLCGFYSTESGTWEIFASSGRASPVEVSNESGLTYPWADLRVFMNPPYGRTFMPRAIEKAASERNNAEIIVGLLPASTDTRWFHKGIRHIADVDFLERRVRFIDPETGEPGQSPPGGSMIVVWRRDWEW